MLELTDREKNLLRLGLDLGAAVGEIQGGAVKLFQSLRRRGVAADEILSSLTGNDTVEIPVSPAQSMPDYGLTRMPFGRHRGEMFMDIPPMDLRKTLRWMQETADKVDKFKDLIFAVDQFLKQTRHI
jgi:hypothetical protein